MLLISQMNNAQNNSIGWTCQQIERKGTKFAQNSALATSGELIEKIIKIKEKKFLKYFIIFIKIN